MIQRIDEVGRIFIDFSGPKAFVQKNWQNIWSEEEIGKLAPEEQSKYREELRQILDVTFIKRSEEPEQKDFKANLTSFTESGLVIKMHFSHPLLVSMGDDPDRVNVRLLKSFFMTP